MLLITDEMTKSESKGGDILKTFTIILLISIFVICLINSTYPIGGDIVGHWTFDDGKGEKVKDSSKEGNDGLIRGNFQWVQGRTGGALLFIRADTTYVEVPNNASLDIKNQITMLAWIKPTSIYTGGNWQERNCIMAKRQAYYLDINEEGFLASYLYGVSPQEWLIGKTNIKKFIGNWVHVATTYDGNEHKLFVNGKLDASVKKSGAITVIGNNFSIGWVDYNRYFDGAMDDAMLWSVALSDQEIANFFSLSVNEKHKLTTCWGGLKRSFR